MGGHDEHVGNVFFIDHPGFSRSQPHVGGIDNHQPRRAQFADMPNVIFRCGSAVDHRPAGGGIAGTELRQ
ncbi:hypothetical protein D3C72_2246100 [compost metagenome]